jgi:O-antigen/teichoic acid export membrane protein
MELNQYLIQFKIKKLLKSTFVRNMTTITGGTAIAQIVTIAFSPIITRLYGPEAFGILGVFLSITAILLTISTLCYVHAMVLPKDDTDGLLILKLSLKIATIFAIITAGVIIPFGGSIAPLLDMEVVAPYLFLIPLSVYLASLAQGYDQWLIRTKHFKASSSITIIQSLSLNGLKTGIGFFAPFAVVLIGLSTLGNGIHALLSAVFSHQSRQPVKKLLLLEEQKRTKELAIEYRDFPYYRAPREFLGSISRNIPIILLATLFSPNTAGLYAIGERVLKLPTTLISQALGKVFLPRISEAAHNGENIQKLIIKATLGLAGFGIIPYGLVIAFGPWLFGFVFGAEWIKAGEYARWLAVWMFIQFISVPCSQAVAVLGMQRWYLMYEIISVALRFLSLIIGFYIVKDNLMAIIFFCISGTILGIILIYWVIKQSGHHLRWQ